jgi:hypothetical protein
MLWKFWIYPLSKFNYEKPHLDGYHISIARDFSKTPGSRYRHEGNFSGEEFRETILVPILHEAIINKTMLNIDLDGTCGYACCFLEEAFGGLIRHNYFIKQEIFDHIKFKSDEESHLIDYILLSIDTAKYLN